MSGRKSKKKNKNFGDVTLNDHANAKIVSNRQKKSNSSVAKLTKVVETPIEAEWEDLAEENVDLVNLESEDGSVSIRAVKKSLKNNFADDSTEVSPCEGIKYPSIVWFLIAEFILPEDVGRFAGICRDSLFVTTFAKFWYGLYKRCRHVDKLPERLQPQHMKRRYGLRSLVIRSLFHAYPPYMARPLNAGPSQTELLLRTKCVSMWYDFQPSKNQYTFYFKMKLGQEKILRTRSSGVVKKDWFSTMDDINANDDDNCKILKITCVKFTKTPYVIGMVLSSFRLCLSTNMRDHHAVMGFSPGFHQPPDSFINLAGIARVLVLDWWLPLYPHSSPVLPPFRMSSQSEVHWKEQCSEPSESSASMS